MRGTICSDHLPSADWSEFYLLKWVSLVVFSPFQDIVLTLKDKLSIRAIEYFALVLEQQYSITKLLLLHEDELIQKARKHTIAPPPPLVSCFDFRNSLNVYIIVSCLHQVVQKKDSHDYRCLFRVCFIPRDPTDMQQEDTFAFEYLFLQVRDEQLLLGQSSQH